MENSGATFLVGTWQRKNKNKLAVDFYFPYYPDVAKSRKLSCWNGSSGGCENILPVSL